MPKPTRIHRNPCELLEPRQLMTVTFARATVLTPSAESPFNIFSADVNGDGRTDLVFTSSLDSGAGWNLSVRTSKPDGSFNAVRSQRLPAEPRNITVRDLNNDRRADIVFSASNSQGTSDFKYVAFGTLAGAFSTAAVIPGLPEVFARVLPGRFTADNNPDLAVINAQNDVSVYAGNGAGVFSTRPTYSISLGSISAPTRPDLNLMKVGDINGDGFDDLIARNSASGQDGIILVRSGSNGRLARATFTSTANTGFIADFAVGDLNRDNKADLLIAVSTGGDTSTRVGVMLQQSSTVLAAPRYIDVASRNTQANAITLGDFTGDGVLDLAFATVNFSFNSSSNSSVLIYRNNGSGTLSPFGSSPTNVARNAIAAGDFNGDRKSDLIVNSILNAAVNLNVRLNTTPGGTTIPTAPNALTATVTGSTTVRLNWADRATNETGYRVERATNSAGPWTQITQTARNIKTYTATSLRANTTYFFRVRATNSAGNSGFSNVVSARTRTSGLVAQFSPRASPDSIIMRQRFGQQLTDGLPPLL